MKSYTVKIESIYHVTPDVLRIVVNKPLWFDFEPGRATEISINKDAWLKEKRPFTMTSLPENNFLEFMIKTYPERKGVTNELLHLKKDDELILHDVFGAIAYKGEGVFIAGGAGVTPFISILRDLKVKDKIGKNMLLFANKTKADILLEKEFENLLGTAFVNILSDEQVDGYSFGRITEEFLKENIENFNQQFYLCGPPPMMKEMEETLKNLGVNTDLITKETY
ncbi:MAG: flavodoxin reductase [bacterium]|nr:flavodoxin reductase [bacterium]